MKNLFLAASLFTMCFSFSSCTQKACGGWYGNRNLDVTAVSENANAPTNFALMDEKELADCK